MNKSDILYLKTSWASRLWYSNLLKSSPGSYSQSVSSSVGIMSSYWLLAFLLSVSLASSRLHCQQLITVHHLVGSINVSLHCWDLDVIFFVYWGLHTHFLLTHEGDYGRQKCVGDFWKFWTCYFDDYVIRCTPPKLEWNIILGNWDVPVKNHFNGWKFEWFGSFLTWYTRSWMKPWQKWRDMSTVSMNSTKVQNPRCYAHSA